ncbi:MAG: aconitase X, partial [Methanocorpusculum sp.]|nr:aconitase X [Methanocorpusculum sp.]
EVEELFGDLEADVVAIGCPHLSNDELKEVASLLEGKRVVMPVYIFVAADLKHGNEHYYNTIVRSGAKIVPDTCMVVSPIMDKAGVVMTNSGKAFTYLPGMCGATPLLGTLEECIRVGCGE